MKKIILGTLIALSSTSVFAADASQCKNLLGSYTCTLGTDVMPLKLEATSANTVKISFAGQEDAFILDGQVHAATGNGTHNVSRAASCNAGAIEVKQYFGSDKVDAKTTPESVTTISAKGAGVNYRIVKPEAGRDDQVDCVKN
jgi:hypothetical protein